MNSCSLRENFVILDLVPQYVSDSLARPKKSKKYHELLRIQPNKIVKKSAKIISNDIGL